MKKILCFLGFHKWKFVTWSQYSYATSAFDQTCCRMAINKCSHCGEYSTPPKWYKKEFRKKYPPVDITGWQTDWNPEVKEIAEL